MRLFILIALFIASQAMAEDLTLVGLLTNNDGYVLRIADTDVAISNSVATAANLANWVGEQVEVKAQGTVVIADGVRRITLSSIGSVAISEAEDE